MTLERALGVLFGGGTAVACVAIAAGLIVPAPAAVQLGIATLIALPALRVLIMAASYLYARDVRLAIVALLVLAIIAVSVLVGLRGARASRYSSASSSRRPSR